MTGMQWGRYVISYRCVYATYRYGNMTGPQHNKREMRQAGNKSGGTCGGWGGSRSLHTTPSEFLRKIHGLYGPLPSLGDTAGPTHKDTARKINSCICFMLDTPAPTWYNTLRDTARD